MINDEYKRIAASLKWQQCVSECYDSSQYWREIYLRFYCVSFSEGYVKDCAEEAFVQTLLTVMAYSEGFELNFWAETSTEIEGLEYTVLDDGTVEISRYTGSETKLEIPETIDGKKVTSIGTMSFLEAKQIKSIKIPDSVTRIKIYAFDHCKQLENISIPESVIVFGEEAFRGTPWLEKQRQKSPFVVVNNVLIDGKSLKGNVIIPDGFQIIGDGAFLNCIELTSIVIPESVTTIGNDVFMHCTNLKSITIPASVTFIVQNSFEGCSDITICGYKDSYAQSFAEENNIPFVIIGSETNTPGNKDEDNIVVTTTPVTTTKVSETTTPVTTTKAIETTTPVTTTKVSETTTPVTTTKVTETTTPGNKDVVKGDIDKDGKISLIDLIRFKSVMLSDKEEISDLSVWDINDDGKFNILDYIYFLELFNNVDQ